MFDEKFPLKSVDLVITVRLKMVSNIIILRDGFSD